MVLQVSQALQHLGTLGFFSQMVWNKGIQEAEAFLDRTPREADSVQMGKGCIQNPVQELYGAFGEGEVTGLARTALGTQHAPCFHMERHVRPCHPVDGQGTPAALFQMGPEPIEGHEVNLKGNVQDFGR
jgi:hypothetical protein